MANELRIGGAVVDFQGRNQQFLRTVRSNEAALKRQSRSVDQARRRFSALRQSITGLASPLLGVAAAYRAVSVNTRFESSLAKIQGLVGVARDEVAGFRDELLSLSGQVARSPVELADALFFITSAGFRGAAALDVLRLSATASAAGLGETKVVADAATSAINAYGLENLSAEKAVAVLLGTVREGKAEAETIAPVFGRVTGAAAALGIEFDELAAVIAALTRGGLNAAESATALNAILKAIAAPAERSKKEIDRLGLSIDELQRIAREEGLVQYLNVLKTVANGNIDTIKKLVGEFRGVNAVLQLTGANLENYIDIANSLSTASVDDLTAAFEAQQQTLSFQYQRAMALVDAQLIKLGATVLPHVASALKVVSDNFTLLAGIVGSLFLDKVVVQVATMSSGLALLIPQIATLNTRLKGTRLALTGLLKAGSYIGIGLLLWEAFSERTKDAKDELDGVNESLKGLQRQMNSLRNSPPVFKGGFLGGGGGPSIESLERQYDKLLERKKELEAEIESAKQLRNPLEGVLGDKETQKAQLKQLEDFANRAREILDKINGKTGGVGKVARTAALDSFENLKTSLQNEIREVEQSIESLGVDQESGARDRLLAVYRTLNRVADERLALQNRLNEAVKSGNEEEAARLEKSVALLSESGERVKELTRLSEELADRRRTLNSLTDEQIQLDSRLQSVTSSLKYSFENTFTSIITGAESAADAVRNLALTIINELARALIAQPIAAGLAGILQPALGSLFGAAAFGGASAGGGVGPNGGILANAGRFAAGGLADGLSFVGEQGPELVDFRNPARVYSNADLTRALGSETGGIVLNFNPTIQSSDGPGVRKALFEVLPRFEESLRNSLRQDAKRPSSFRNALRGG